MTEKGVVVGFAVSTLLLLPFLLLCNRDTEKSRTAAQKDPPPPKIDPKRLVLHFALVRGRATTDQRGSKFQFGAEKAFHQEPWRRPSFDPCNKILQRHFPNYKWSIEQKGRVRPKGGLSFPFSVMPETKYGKYIHQRYAIVLKPSPPEAPNKVLSTDTIDFRTPDGTVSPTRPRKSELPFVPNRFSINWISEGQGNATGVVYFWTEE